jgi:hypothetical protein
MTTLLLAVLFAAPATADTQWVLKESTLAYHLSHPLHQSEGTSHAARGKAVCHAGRCDFLVAVPVKTFDSGDSNRDLHMIQVVRGAQFPMVTVRFQLPEEAGSLATIRADLLVEFAGRTAEYKQVAFERVTRGSETHVTGTIPAKLSDFKIDPPSLLALPTKDEIPIRVDTTWAPN